MSLRSSLRCEPCAMTSYSRLACIESRQASASLITTQAVRCRVIHHGSAIMTNRCDPPHRTLDPRDSMIMGLRLLALLTTHGFGILRIPCVLHTRRVIGTLSQTSPTHRTSDGSLRVTLQRSSWFRRLRDSDL